MVLARLGRGFATFVLTETNQSDMKNPRSLPDSSTAPGGFGSKLSWLAAWLGILMAVAFMLATQPAQAQRMLDPNTVLPGTNYINYADQVSAGRLVWIKAQTTSSNIVYFSGVRYDGWNILTINPYTHSALGPFTILQIGNGGNFNTDPGQVVGISEVVVNPNADQSIVHLAQYISGIDMTFGTPPPFRSPVVVSGFGEYALIYGDIQPQDGYRRAFQMTMSSTANRLAVSDTVINFLLNPGSGLVGCSGGLVETLEGDFLGHVVAGTPSNTGTIQSTFYTPYDLNFINQNIYRPPSPLFIDATTNFGFASQQFRFTLTGPAGSNAVIAASTNLQTWSPLVTNTLVGGSLNFTDILATNYLRRFYRANLQ